MCACACEQKQCKIRLIARVKENHSSGINVAAEVNQLSAMRRRGRVISMFLILLYQYSFWKRYIFFPADNFYRQVVSIAKLCLHAIVLNRTR